MSRKTFTEKDTLLTLLYCGVMIPCYRCKVPLVISDSIEREHVTELALGGADDYTNCVYSHAVCHLRVTNGTKATTAGSSKHIIAKVKRIARGGKVSRRPFQRKKDVKRTFQTRY